MAKIGSSASKRRLPRSRCSGSYFRRQSPKPGTHFRSVRIPGDSLFLWPSFEAPEFNELARPTRTTFIMLRALALHLHHLKIDNTSVPAVEAARKIAEHFGLRLVEDAA